MHNTKGLTGLVDAYSVDQTDRLAVHEDRATIQGLSAGCRQRDPPRLLLREPPVSWFGQDSHEELVKPQ